ncbi:DUF6531 domain-containing protein [Testudinibacter sp. TR-2022]|uniref:DUF6531 domain-containing protein n=1 Tax=Testudinibacter sp. TR-2022 TaxID=2585029 RepID=UPI00111992CC|nr:DUF6531 domain-containing protein [Testudinibacter sp. TR-2022]TNH06585.1 RHS repeat protein [Pasteurellaceae bacterium Phil11]TNH23092.1 RHS repeat protein [Testudinibacter sp. TR-2022]TNH25030.1 RHS repeat protein [Testudinibacter sp. TR-2022]
MTFIVRFPQNAGLKRFILAKDKLVRGDPIDVLTGYLVEQRTDFTLGQTLPLHFTRTWARHKAADHADGLCGRYWVDNFSEYAELSGNGQHVQIATLEGSYLRFALPLGSTQSVNPDQPQFTLNRHRDYLELVNRDTRSAKCFALPEAWLADHDEALGFAPLQDGRLRLSRWLDLFENEVRFHYTDEPQGQSRLTRVTHSDGIELTLVYQSSSYGHVPYLQQIVRTDSEQPQVLVRYTQDSLGCLIESDALLDYHLFYHYDSQYHLTRWADNDQTWVDYHYDHQGRCVHSIGADGYYPVWFDYHDGLTLVYDSQRRCTRYQFDTRLMKPLQITTDSGATTRFDYDHDGNLLTQTLPEGQTLRFDYLGQTGLVSTFYAADGEAWHYQYDEEEQLCALTDPLDRTWTRQTDEDERTTLFTAPDGSQTEFQLNQHGLLTRINSRIGQSQRQQQFHYDPRHRLIAEQDAEQRRIQFDYDRHDNLTALRRANGTQWHYGYNPHGKLSRIDRPNDSREQQDYDRHGNLIRYTDANGVVWQLRYGAFDLLSEKIDGEGNRWQYDYDKDSLKLNQVTNPLGETYTYTFNADGLVETETDFADNRWTFRYDENGNLLHLTNGEGEQTDYRYDDNGRLVQLHCGADGYHYQYDKVGRVSRIDTVDSCLQYRYDDLDRIVEEWQGRQRITREYDDEQ